MTGREHLSSRKITAYLEGELDAPERSEVEAHLADCSECRREVRSAWGLLSWWRRRRRTRVALAVAGAAAAVLLLVFLPFGDGPGGDRISPDTPFRDTGPAAAAGRVQSLSVHGPGDGAVLPDGSSPVRLRWESVSADVTYRVTLTAEDGTPVWSATTRDTVAPVPPDVRLRPGALYLWYVDALLPDGTSATTGTHSFRIEP